MSDRSHTGKRAKTGQNFLATSQNRVKVSCYNRVMVVFMQDLEEPCAKFRNVKDSLMKMMVKCKCRPHFQNKVHLMKTMMLLEDYGQTQPQNEVNSMKINEEAESQHSDSQNEVDSMKMMG
jgi:hypothetical protein